MTREDFARVLAYLSAAVGKPVPTETAEVYFDLLGDLPLPALQFAAKQALLESKYPTLPTAGTLRQLALTAMSSPDQRMTAAEAWGLVCRAIRACGLDREEAALASLPDDVAATTRAIGWQSLCDSTEPEVARAQFTKAYDAIAERSRRTNLLPAPLRELLELVGESVESRRPLLPDRRTP